MKNLRKQASETLTDVQVASSKVVATSEWAAVALVAVAGVSVLALVVAVIALGKVNSER